MLKIVTLTLLITAASAMEQQYTFDALPNELKSLIFSKIDHFDLPTAVRKQMALKRMNKQSAQLVSTHEYKKKLIKQWSQRYKIGERVIAYYLHERPADFALPLVNEAELLDEVIARFDNSTNCKRIISALVQDICTQRSAEDFANDILTLNFNDELFTLHRYLYNSQYVCTPNQLYQHCNRQILTPPPAHIIKKQYKDETLLIAASCNNQPILKISNNRSDPTFREFGLQGNVVLDFECKPQTIIPERIIKQEHGSIIVQGLYAVGEEISLFIVRINSKGSLLSQYIKPCHSE